MTERATGKGYSWWWAGHIRTKQSKWLEQNLQDMDDKVEHVLNLIQKDGDSFARRAEMYYKHRPEVISFVEETVRAYRSLAERYDKLSTELQKANTTIASICPEKVTYSDDDDYTVGPSKLKSPKRSPKKKAKKIPKAPKPPPKGFFNNASKTTIKANPSVPESDFIKDGQDQLKSCEETLEKLTQDAKLEQQMFDEAKSKLDSLKHKFNMDQVDNEEENESNLNSSYVVELGKTLDKLVNKVVSLETSVTSQTVHTDTLRKENDDLTKQIQNLATSQTLKTDTLRKENDDLTKQIQNLVTSQTVQSEALRKENEDLTKLIQNLEAEKAALKNPTKVVNLKSEVRYKDEVRWLNMLLSGLENKEEILLEEFITILKSYKDTKNKLSEEEKRNESAIIKRDNTIRLLTQKLTILQESLGEDKVDIPSIDFLNEPQVVSESEEKLRMDIDAILNQNLDLLLAFSGTFRQVHKFKTQAKDLFKEVKKVKAKGILSDIKPIYANLKTINTRLTTWLKQSTTLKDELDMINSYLSSIHDEITSQGAKFSMHEAAKFKGEIWNMKQENDKVNVELEEGLKLAIGLKHEIEQTLEKLQIEFGGSITDQDQPRKGRSIRRSVTLKSLLFGGKTKKQKFSLFSCMGYHNRTRSI